MPHTHYISTTSSTIGNISNGCVCSPTTAVSSSSQVCIMRLLWLFEVLALTVFVSLFSCSSSYRFVLSSALRPSRTSTSSSLLLSSKRPPVGEEEGKEAELTEVGSTEYYKGFFTSDLQDSSINTSQRGDGLDQAIKIGAYTAGFLVVLVLGFLASNGLL